MNKEEFELKLQQENKQLKEAIETLKETNELLVQQKGQLYENLDMVDKRIDKAIQLLNKHSIDCFEKCYDNNDFSEIMNIILEILKGENK